MHTATVAAGTLTVAFAATQLFGGSGKEGSPFSSLQVDKTVLVSFGRYGEVRGNASEIDTTANNVYLRAKIKKISEPWILGTVGNSEVWINLGEAHWVRTVE